MPRLFYYTVPLQRRARSRLMLQALVVGLSLAGLILVGMGPSEALISWT